MESNVGTQLEHHRADDKRFAYKGVKLTGAVTKSWENGLRTSFGLNVGKRDFEDNYILRSFPRADDFWGVSASLFSPKFEFKGIAPRLSCSYTRNRSNIEFFIYNVSECRIALTRNF